MMKSGRMRGVGQIPHVGDTRNASSMFVRIPEVKRPPGRHRHSWEDNIRMDLREIACKRVDLMHLAKDSSQW
jgi:hypothetical protein